MHSNNVLGAFANRISNEVYDVPTDARLADSVCEDDGENRVSHPRLPVSIYFVRKLSRKTDWAFLYLRYIPHPNPSCSRAIFGIQAPVLYVQLLRNDVNRIASIAGFENCATRV